MIAMSNNAAIDLTTVQEWISAKRDPKVIEEELLSNGLDAEAVSMHRFYMPWYWCDDRFYQLRADFDESRAGII